MNATRQVIALAFSVGICRGAARRCFHGGLTFVDLHALDGNRILACF